MYLRHTGRAGFNTILCIMSDLIFNIPSSSYRSPGCRDIFTVNKALPFSHLFYTFFITSSPGCRDIFTINKVLPISHSFYKLFAFCAYVLGIFIFYRIFI